MIARVAIWALAIRVKLAFEKLLRTWLALPVIFGHYDSMVRIPKLRLLREKKRAALQEIAKLEARIAELRVLVSDYDIADRVLASLSAIEGGDDIDIQIEAELEADTGALVGPIGLNEAAQQEVERKKPKGVPTVPEMIYEALRLAAARGENGLEPAAMLKFIQEKYWPTAGSSDIGSTAWRLWRRANKLNKVGSIYSLRDEQEKKTQNAA